MMVSNKTYGILWWFWYYLHIFFYIDVNIYAGFVPFNWLSRHNITKYTIYIYYMYIISYFIIIQVFLNIFMSFYLFSFKSKSNPHG